MARPSSCAPRADGPLRLHEVFGLAPLPQRLREAAAALRGDAFTPKSRFGLSALAQLVRVPGPQVWAGRRPCGRRVLISNLVNRTPTPPERGWSVRVTQVRDFRGGTLSYDSHNGTDFATPVGTLVVAPAPGVVRRVASEFHRGGLKVFLDHGGGLVTSANHLARALVREGDRVVRGEPIARSGYSGLDGVVTFPFGIPHVHWNVYLDGRHVDPFAVPGEASLWLDGNAPQPYRGTLEDARNEPLPESAWDHDAVEAGIAACRCEASAAAMRAQTQPEARAVAYVFFSSYFPTRFAARPRPYRITHPRVPRFTLPFSARDYDGVAFEVA